MGTDKNIKLHIVTDIKVCNRKMLSLTSGQNLYKSLQRLTLNARLLSLTSLSLKDEKTLENEGTKARKQTKAKRKPVKRKDKPAEGRYEGDMKPLNLEMKRELSKVDHTKLMNSLLGEIESNPEQKFTDLMDVMNRSLSPKSKQGEEFTSESVKSHETADISQVESGDIDTTTHPEELPDTHTEKFISVSNNENSEYEILEDKGIDVGRVDVNIEGEPLSHETDTVELQELNEDMKHAPKNVTRLMNLFDDIDKEQPNPELKFTSSMDALHTNTGRVDEERVVDSRQRVDSEQNIESEQTVDSKQTLDSGVDREEELDSEPGVQVTGERKHTRLFPNYNEMDDTEPENREMSLDERSWFECVTLTNKQTKNRFDAMIEEVMEGREWQFPIDNEQDLGIEDETDFQDHVFLDHYLDEFPDVQQIQQHMELVINGLQKNPWLTAEEKRRRILWHKEFFEQFTADDFA